MRSGFDGFGRLGAVLAVAGTAAAFTMGASAPAMAQDYPSRSLDWVVMWSAGGGADTATRVFTRHLEEELGQSIVVRNVTGGGGSIGYLEAQRQRPDGHHLVTIQGDLPKFNPMQLAPIEIDDFDHIAGFAVQSPIIIVRADSPWETLEDFVEDARANPGQRTIGVSDIGGVHHQPVVLWAEQAGIEIQAVAHDGSPQMNAAILGGHVDAISSYVRPAAPYVDEGQLKFLGYFGSTPPSAFPDVPTFLDLGYDVVWDQPYGMGAPAGIPDEARQKLAEAAERIWAKPEFVEELANLGLDLYDASGEEMREALLEMQTGIARVLEILHGSN